MHAAPTALALVDDIGKYVVLIACAGALLVLARWASGLGGNDATRTAWSAEELDAPVPAHPKMGPESVLQFLPPDPRLGSWHIVGFYFSQFDAVPGPVDPKSFCDELFVRLHDARTGYSWTQSYLVATPEGLSTLLREKSWKYLRTGSVIVLPAYELREIHRAVADYLVEDQKMDESDPTLREPRE